MRRDEALIADMLDAAQRIGQYIRGLTREQFLEARMVRDAVERQILTLGEASSRTSAAFREAHPEVPWQRLIELRNFYVHAYERVEGDLVWSTAGGLVRRVEGLIRPLVPDPEE